MTKHFNKVPIVKLATGTTYTHPPEPPLVVHFDDPAEMVMKDFKQANAFTIEPTAKLAEASMEMKVCRTHMLLVVDKLDQIIGMITSEDIMGQKPLAVSRDRFIKHDDIIVRMLMTSQEKICAINLEEIKLAKVGDIVLTLHALKQHYALAVEIDALTGEQNVCGLFALSQISKQLGVDVTSGLSEARSLSELQKKLKGD